MNKMNVPVGLTVIAVLVASAHFHVARATDSLQLTFDANSVWIRARELPVLQYCCHGVGFKPYVKELFTVSGMNILLDAPPDHPHHHALMFACAVNGIDFWGEYAGQTGDRETARMAARPGKQVHQGLKLRQSFLAVGQEVVRRLPYDPCFREPVQWVSQADDEILLMEERTIAADRCGEPRATLLTWKSRLSVPQAKESATLSGSHYHGLGMRFIRSMDGDGEFRNPDNDPGVVFRGAERLLRSRWCAYTAQADGKLVTAAMFDHPDNPRHPATWFTMAKPFAYLSATMRLHEEPLKVPRDKPLLLRYGVALWDGRIETPQIDALYKHWVSTETKSVR